MTAHYLRLLAKTKIITFLLHSCCYHCKCSKMYLCTRIGLKHKSNKKKTTTTKTNHTKILSGLCFYLDFIYPLGASTATALSAPHHATNPHTPQPQSGSFLMQTLPIAAKLHPDSLPLQFKEFRRLSKTEDFSKCSLIVY